MDPQARPISQQDLPADLLSLLAQIAEDFIAQPGRAIDASIERTLATIGVMFDADRASVFTLDDNGTSLSNSHEWCAAGVTPQKANLQQLPAVLFPWWMAEMGAGRPIHLANLEDLPAEATAERELLQSQDIHSLLVLPLVRRGRLDGCAGVVHIRGCRRWSDQEIAVLRVVVGSFAQGFGRRLLDQRLERLAYEDPLTALPNRTLLSQRLEQALSRNTVPGRLLAVCFLDLDAFKAVNDAHGHAVGDQLLVVIAQRLHQCLRPVDTVGRMGGDEFILIFPELDSRDQLRQLGQACLDAISLPCVLSETAVVRLTTSLGVRLVPAGDGVDADTLLRQADQAM